MAIDVKKKIRKERVRNFVAKDFDALRNELLSYARVYFPEKIQDFSEASLGGLFLDLAAMVGDTMSYYLDHQFNELNPLTAIESNNVIRHLREAGVNMVGASPASVYVRFYIEVPAEKQTNGEYQPKLSAMPVILEGTVLRANSGITFNLADDLDFADKDKAGKFTARISTNEKNANGTPSTFIVSKEGLCISGVETTESFNIGAAHEAFREIVMTNPNISEILSVTDSELNTYYEVQALSQDTVFRAILNVGTDNKLVHSNMEIIPAPRRFVSRFDPRTKVTVIRFGSGDASSFEDDIIPDPSKLALPLYGKKTFARFSIDPQSLLKTNTLGISPKATTITVRYRFGGGLDHNVPAASIRFVDEVIIFDSDLEDVRNHISPDVVVKGGEWTSEEVRVRDNIPDNIEIKLFPIVDDYSTTNTIKKIQGLDSWNKK